MLSGATTREEDMREKDKSDAQLTIKSRHINMHVRRSLNDWAEIHSF
jgi:hypothetical protein